MPIHATLIRDAGIGRDRPPLFRLEEQSLRWSGTLWKRVQRSREASSSLMEAKL